MTTIGSSKTLHASLALNTEKGNLLEPSLIATHAQVLDLVQVKASHVNTVASGLIELLI